MPKPGFERRFAGDCFRPRETPHAVGKAPNSVIRRADPFDCEEGFEIPDLELFRADLKAHLEQRNHILTKEESKNLLGHRPTDR